MIAAFGVAAIVRYNVEGALKILGVMSGVIGLLTGAFGTYFFTRYPIAEARQKAAIAETRAAEAESKLATATQQATTFAARVASAPDQVRVGSLRRDPEFAKFLAYGPWQSGIRYTTKPNLEPKPVEGEQSTPRTEGFRSPRAAIQGTDPEKIPLGDTKLDPQSPR